MQFANTKRGLMWDTTELCGIRVRRSAAIKEPSRQKEIDPARCLIGANFVTRLFYDSINGYGVHSFYAQRLIHGTPLRRGVWTFSLDTFDLGAGGLHRKMTFGRFYMAL